MCFLMCVLHLPDLTLLVEKEYFCMTLGVCVTGSVMLLMTGAKGNVRNADASSNSTESSVTQGYSFPQLYFNHMSNQFIVKLC